MCVVHQEGSRQLEQSFLSPFFGAKPILVYVDHTSRFERNTGIQRCVRSLSSDLGLRIYQFVCWKTTVSTIQSLSSPLMYPFRRVFVGVPA